MIEAWGRSFEKIREACALYDGPLPEYEINEAGIMVLCKACDKYLELLRNDGQHHGQSDQESDHNNDQVIIKQIIEFCRELSQTNQRVRIKNTIHKHGQQLGQSDQVANM